MCSTALNIPWEVHVPDEYVMAGNAAVLRCVIPPHCADRVSTTDWFTDNEVAVSHYLGMYISITLYVSSICLLFVILHDSPSLNKEKIIVVQIKDKPN